MNLHADLMGLIADTYEYHGNGSTAAQQAVYFILHLHIPLIKLHVKNWSCRR